MTTHELKVVCCYCGLFLGTKPCQVEPKPGLDTSHGLCDKCAEIQHKKIDELIAKQKEKL